jgi:ribosomal protein S18 acetylase RimI-like enzyme
MKRSILERMKTKDCPNVLIRRVGPNRTEDLLALEESCFPMDRISRKNLLNLLRSTSAFCVAAYQCRELVGSMVVLFRAGTRVARVYSLAVRPDSRGKGVGRRMLARADKEARLRGCTRIRLEVRMDNIPAIRLYEHLGYVDVKVIPNYYEDDTHAMVYLKEL